MDDQNKHKRSGCVVFVSALALAALGGWLLLRGLARGPDPAEPARELARYDGR